jgi:prephenate dehydrogenase
MAVMSDSHKQYGSIAIVGVGLIGGSIALAARQRGVCRHVVGVGRSSKRLEQAQHLQLIDSFETDIQSLKNVDLIVVCTPVDRIVKDVTDVLQATPETTLVTDAGSVKASICHALAKIGGAAARFIGSHPLAGSHQSGFENADADLYIRRKCVVTPMPDSPKTIQDSITSFWRALGMDVRLLTPEEHDRVLAFTSHLPHLAAAAVASLLNESAVDFAATGFRDTTRIAAGDPDLWSAIFSENTEQLVAATDDLIEVLQQYRGALTAGNFEDVQTLLKSAQHQRLLYENR